ncbi:MAG: hypothetical protein JNM86_07745 [Phycisphaerae bacterium]|nr:hypothetical protein [Phycisphaerae bacterium]
MDRISRDQWSPGLAGLPEHSAWGDSGNAIQIARFNDPRTVLVSALAAAPARSTVYPSERYFYFETIIESRQVSGNIRFTDIERGQVHIGYFDRFDPEARQGGTFSAENGVVVASGPLPHTWIVSADGHSREFTLDQQYQTFRDRLALLPDEEFVTGVYDESGSKFGLIFFRPTASLYFVLVPDKAGEPLVSVRGDATEFLVGLHSRFVYFVDQPTGRRILVGVHSSNVRDNNYFDGPFDQVPPDLSLREMLNETYPYTKFRGGIDEHGNFNSFEGQRVAISPYQQYTSTDRLLEQLLKAKGGEGAEGPKRWVAMVYENKRHFHEEMEEYLVNNINEYPNAANALPSYSHVVGVSRSWPASHFFYSSRQWARGFHDPGVSTGWPPNHVMTESSGSAK